MTPATIERRGAHRHDTPWLDEHLGAWRSAGLISDAQASALHDFEVARQATEPEVRLGPVAEAAAFIGTILALVGAGVGLGPQWGDIDLALRLAIAAALAAVGFLAGRWLIELGEPGTLRLGGFLWVLGTAGVALATGTLVNDVRPDSPWVAVAVGLPAAAIGAALWHNRERPLQLLSAAVGLSIASGGVMALADLDGWHAAAPTFAVGAALWGATMRTTLHPLAVVRGLGGAAMVSGTFMVCDLTVRWGAALALVVAAGVIVLALRQSETLALVVGATGAFMAVQTLVQTTFHGPAGGAVLALAGLAMVVLVVARARATRRE